MARVVGYKYFLQSRITGSVSGGVENSILAERRKARDPRGAVTRRRGATSKFKFCPGEVRATSRFPSAYSAKMNFILYATYGFTLFLRDSCKSFSQTENSFAGASVSSFRIQIVLKDVKI